MHQAGRKEFGTGFSEPLIQYARSLQIEGLNGLLETQTKRVVHINSTLIGFILYMELLFYDTNFTTKYTHRK